MDRRIFLGFTLAASAVTALPATAPPALREPDLISGRGDLIERAAEQLVQPPLTAAFFALNGAPFGTTDHVCGLVVGGLASVLVAAPQSGVFGRVEISRDGELLFTYRDEGGQGMVQGDTIRIDITVT